MENGLPPIATPPPQLADPLYVAMRNDPQNHFDYLGLVSQKNLAKWPAKPTTPCPANCPGSKGSFKFVGVSIEGLRIKMKAETVKLPEPTALYGGSLRVFVYTCFWDSEKESDIVDDTFNPKVPGGQGIAAYAKWRFWSCINGEWKPVYQNASRSYEWSENTRKWIDNTAGGGVAGDPHMEP